MLLRTALSVTFLLITTSASAQPDRPALSAPPAWVEAVPAPALRSEEPSSSGVAYLLLDEQVRVAGRSHARYVHAARGIVNEQGVAAASQLSVSYDPSYQRLTLHRVTVRRGEREIDQLQRDRIEMLRRETGMEANLYDGEVTASLLLDDVRVGDIIEYAYTISGANPIFDGRYFGGFDMGWFAPARRVRYRLLWPSDRTLYLQPHHTEVEPVVTRQGEVTEYRWALDDVETLSFDDGLPYWYNPYPWVQFSEAGTWAEVAAWGENLFQRSGPLPSALRPIVAAIADTAEAPAERVVAALRFAQDEIRYTGLEMGVGSHRPRPPSEVLRTRFGDCKDKALLLTTMLDALGIDADPALVSVNRGRGIDDWHPSPYAFDHAIVRATVGGTSYWLDPTRLHQRGALDDLAQADYDRALLLRPGTTSLTAMEPPRSESPDRRVAEYLDLSGGVDEPAPFTVTTTLTGSAADDMRARLARTSLDELAEDYINYYAALFPSIEPAEEPLEVDDDPILNWLIIYERYVLPEPWEVRDDGFQYLDLYAKETALLLEAPFTRRRTMPLGLSHPYEQHHEIDLRLADAWSIEDEHTAVENEAFAFTFNVEMDGPLLMLDYTYRTKADHVPAEATAAYLDDLETANATMGYQLYQPAGRAAGGPQSTNWPVLLLAFIAMGLALAAAWRVYQWEPKSAPIDPALTDQTLRGIAGWLLLIAFYLLAQPIVLLVQIAEMLPALETTTWNSLTQPGSPAYHPLMAPVLLFELVANLFWLVFSLLLPVLFFQRRRSFPRIYIVYLIATVVVLTLDVLGTTLLPNVPTSSDSITNLVRRGIAALVWSLYFLKSDRVEATFTEGLPPRRNARQHPAQPSPAL